MAKVNAGEEYENLEIKDGWYLIMPEDKKGWIINKYAVEIKYN